MLHKKMLRKHSIVQRLGWRSMTGRDLCLHVHRHVGSTFLLYYKRKRDIECYKSYIGRLFHHSHEDSLFMKGILLAGIDGRFSCLNRWETYDEFMFHRTCIFLAHLISENHYWDIYRPAKMGFPEFKCTCPIIKNHLLIEGRYLNLHCLRTWTGTPGGRLRPPLEADGEYDISLWAYSVGIDGPLSDDFLLPRRFFSTTTNKTTHKTTIAVIMYFLPSIVINAWVQNPTSYLYHIITHHVNITRSPGLCNIHKYASMSRVSISLTVTTLTYTTFTSLPNYYRGQSHRSIFLQSRDQHIHRLVGRRTHDWWTSQYSSSTLFSRRHRPIRQNYYEYYISYVHIY
jgi:hypothetical protein